jgi:hypothetical protein
VKNPPTKEATVNFWKEIIWEKMQHIEEADWIKN